MKKVIASIAAAVALSGGLAVAATSAPLGAQTAEAKVCSAGYRHAIINGAHKCLRRGQFCSLRATPQYRRYGFFCIGGRLR
jgi:hypothetical protein